MICHSLLRCPKILDCENDDPPTSCKIDSFSHQSKVREGRSVVADGLTRTSDATEYSGYSAGVPAGCFVHRLSWEFVPFVRRVTVLQSDRCTGVQLQASAAPSYAATARQEYKDTNRLQGRISSSTGSGCFSPSRSSRPSLHSALLDDTP